MREVIAAIRADRRRLEAMGASRSEIWASQGMWAMFQYRVAHHLRRRYPRSVLIRAASLLSRKMVEVACGISLPPSARIGTGLYIGHFGAIIVSGQAVIGEGCNISQGVTIGVSGTGDRRGAPTIGDHVYIGAGAKVIGPITVGDFVTIGANAVVTRDIPDGAIVAGVPAEILRIDPAVAAELTFARGSGAG